VRLLVLAFGKLKTPGMRESADYFARNLGPWAKLEEVELKPLPAPDKSAATRTLIQDREAALVQEHLDQLNHPRLILMDETGRMLPTSGWADRVRDWESEGRPIVLVLGSSLGLAPSLKKQSHDTLALGPQTLSHELARVVLFEQLYRAWSVTRGHPYHNA
jgi:23S rRNA (pseudouridine1915-N3)-methyltransferase